jgi:hypothetical protein
MKALTAVFAILALGAFLISINTVSSVSLPSQEISAQDNSRSMALPRSEIPFSTEKGFRLATHKKRCKSNGKSCYMTGTDTECCTHWCGSQNKCAPPPGQ